VREEVRPPREAERPRREDAAHDPPKPKSATEAKDRPKAQENHPQKPKDDKDAKKNRDKERD
jgi:hypothetical protein